MFWRVMISILLKRKKVYKKVSLAIVVNYFYPILLIVITNSDREWWFSLYAWNICPTFCLHFPLFLYELNNSKFSNDCKKTNMIWIWELIYRKWERITTTKVTLYRPATLELILANLQSKSSTIFVLSQYPYTADCVEKTS